MPEIGAFYLAGGTALALHLGHRRSVDFDFFRHEPFDSEFLLRRLISLSPLTVRQAERDTLTVEAAGVMVSFFAYPYALLEPARQLLGPLRLAGVKDIAAMKLSALAGRGSRKDFIDLYFICREVLPLADVLRLGDEKFGDVRWERYHLLRSLTYFDDAESEVGPEMLRPVEWTTVRDFFRAEATRLFEIGS